jgi:hypothetical protein
MSIMAEQDNIHSVDDLQYDWPPNLLRYEQRFLFGLTVTDLLIVAGCMILPMMVHVLLGLLGGLAGLLLVKRFDGLGDRRLPVYLLARIYHHFNRQTISLPRILPAGKGSFEITDLDGNVIAQFGANGRGEHS